MHTTHPTIPHLRLLAALLAASLLAACGGQAQQTANPPTADASGGPTTDAPATTAPEANLPEPLPPRGEPAAGDVVVFAAASLTNAFDEMAAAFEAQNPGLNVVPNYGASSQLAAQLVEGAPADVFASANEMQMGVVVEAGRIDGPTVTFVTNRLTIIVPADNPAGITGLADLATPGVRLVLAAPGVPIREYANQALETFASDPAYDLAYLDAVNANLVSEEDNVRQVAAKVALGEADAGIVYTSDITPDIADNVRQIDIPEAFNVIATYPIGLVTGAPHPDTARAFIDFVLSDEGQAILTQWGFGAAPGD